MSKLGVVEDTLFVPMAGRIYASEHYPRILYDEKALDLKKKLPSALLEQDGQSQYTLLASAARSANMDRFIMSFLERRPVWKRRIIAATTVTLDGTPLICSMWWSTGGSCCRRRSARSTSPGTLFPKTGSGGFALMRRMLPSWLPLVGCSTILRRLRLWGCSRCCRNSERSSLSLML